MFYLEQYSKELLPLENNPNIEPVKDTGLRPDDKTIKTWLWVAYGMVAVKNVFKHPRYPPRVGSNCMDDIQRILSMSREVDFEKIKELWFYLLSETYGTDIADKVKDSLYWKGVFSYHMLYDANGVRELNLLNILLKASSWEVNLDAVRNLWMRSLHEKGIAKDKKGEELT